ncbi:hypothetical protein Acor_04710 [Acrocarpospora corrugata]|uniref:DUF4407 domain-containing protein n=1 Tax=Acrocarpospora corrugata TaxID=35763 RepID=A0A5M3VQW3_9ACTN|nr:DUF4407 domain-containing protein [Acrocarpospora corrugata]GER98409.1 hypothetical protein Acor_04710 [Acrocarpospora corrugata]
MDRIKRFLVALSGARPEVLRRCPTEQGKFEGIGGAVLTTAVLAVISMTFALSTALDVPLPLAIPAALIWGTAILGLDRWLVSTMRSDGGRKWGIALPRILMAVLIGFVVSTPLVLQIFDSEIEARIVQIKQARANEFARQQQQDTIGQDITALRKQVSNLNNVISSDGDVAIDPASDRKFKTLTKERDEQQKLADSKYAEWQCQLYGGPACVKKGNGPLARASETTYRKAQSGVDKLNRQLENRKKQLSTTDAENKEARLAQAKADLPKVQTELDAAVARQADLQRLADAQTRANGGLLLRLQALNEVSGQDFTMRAAHILLFLLFLLIECLPVVVKLMMRPGNYERILGMAAEQEFREAKQSFARRPGVTGGNFDIAELWRRPETAAPPGPGHTVPETPLPEPPEPEPRPDPSRPDPSRPDPFGVTRDHRSLDDESIREMRDRRGLRAHVPDGSDRTSGFELFPEDD